jgi:Cysteine-rich CWC
MGDEPSTPLNESCPRCGGLFHCGAGDAAGCACFELQLTPALTQTLNAEFPRCLCIACLCALQLGAPLHPS